MFQQVMRKFVTFSPLKEKCSLRMMAYRMAIKVILHDIVSIVNYLFFFLTDVKNNMVR
jgi:hypothetical protein